MSWRDWFLGRQSPAGAAQDATETRNIENPSYPLSSYVPPFLITNKTSAGVTVNTETALNYTRVWSAVSRLSETVAALPWQIYSDASGERDLARDHPLYERLQLRPNDDLSSFTFRQVLVAHLYIYGDGYALIVRDDQKQARSFLLAMPPMVRRERRKNGIWYVIRGEREEIAVPAEDMIHIPGFSMDGREGISTVMRGARNAIGMALAAEEHSAGLFSNGARPGGLLVHPEKLTEEARKNLRQSWEEAQAGVANAYKTAVLEEGLTWTQMTMSSVDAQLEQLRRLQVEEIAAVFNIPPVFIGDYQRANFANSEQQDLHYSKHTITPIIRRIEQEFNWKVFRGTGHFCEFNLDGLERGDFKGRVEGLVKAVQGGIKTPNEARKLFNDPPKDGGDRLYLQQNMSDLDKIGDQQNDDEGNPGAPGD